MRYVEKEQFGVILGGGILQVGMRKRGGLLELFLSSIIFYFIDIYNVMVFIGVRYNKLGVTQLLKFEFGLWLTPPFHHFPHLLLPMP